MLLQTVQFFFPLMNSLKLLPKYLRKCFPFSIPTHLERSRTNDKAVNDLLKVYISLYGLEFMQDALYTFDLCKKGYYSLAQLRRFLLYYVNNHEIF